jgi:hypothetical protein
MQEISDFKCPYISKEQIWEQAENFRAEFWSEGILPVDMERIIEKRLKLNIQPVKWGSSLPLTLVKKSNLKLL